VLRGQDFTVCTVLNTVGFLQPAGVKDGFDVLRGTPGWCCYSYPDRRCFSRARLLLDNRVSAQVHVTSRQLQPFLSQVLLAVEVLPNVEWTLQRALCYLIGLQKLLDSA
jgi:hypothetical protein